MAKNSTLPDKKKPYSERRRGGRDRTAALVDSDKTAKKLTNDEVADIDTTNEDSKDSAPLKGTKKSTDFNLKQEKGADLQQEQGADLTTKNRLNEKPGIAETAGNLPMYGSGIKNQKKYRKHVAKVKEYAQPYVSPLADESNVQSDIKPLPTEAKTSNVEAAGIATHIVGEENPEKTKLTEKSSKLEQRDVSSSLKTTPTEPKLKDEPRNALQAESSRWSKVKAGNAENNAEVAPNDEKPSFDSSKPSEVIKPKASKLKQEQSKLSPKKQSNLETTPKNKLETKTELSPVLFDANGNVVTAEAQTPQSDTGANESEKDTKPPRHINTAKSQKSIAYQHKLYDKSDKLTEKGSKLRVQQEQAIEAMPTKDVTITERVYDDETGKMSKLKTTEKRTLHQNETRWNNPKFTQKLRNADGMKEKTKVVATAVGKKGAVLGTAAAVGGTPAVAGALVAKPALQYGSKMVVNEAHRQVRKDIRQNGNNEVLKAAHWAEQKGERALGRGIRKLNPVAIRRYVKNAPYRRESKLKIKELKNDKKLGLLRVKQDKATGVNHMTGKKSNIVTRAWQKRQIKINYQKAMLAAKGKGGGSIGVIALQRPITPSA